MNNIKLTGSLQIEWNEARLEPKPSKPLYLLIYAAYYQDWISREKLAFLFWPDKTDKKSQQNLRGIIFRAKELEFAKDLEVEADRLRWPIKSDISVFKENIVNQNWKQAIENYNGKFLENFSPKNEAGFEAWISQERADLERVWKNAANNYILELGQANNNEAAADLLEQLLAAEPLAEDILQRYLKNCYLLNQNSKAVQAYQEFKKLLKKELDLEPLAETSSIIATIKSSGTIKTVISKKPKAQQLIPLAVLKPPKLIGRNEIIKQLKHAPSNTVFIFAEAGIGKSRLLAEYAPNALKIKCQEGLQNIPFYPIVKLIKSIFTSGIVSPDLKQYNDDLIRLVPDLAPDYSPAPVNPESAKLKLFEALKLYFEHVIKEKNIRGYSLVFDDLQWIDSSSLDFLVYLANQKSLKILASYRTHEKTSYLQAAIDSLKANKLLTLIELEPLSLKQLKDFMASLMGVNKGPEIFSQWLAKNTNGNPMFVLETLKSLFESGTLAFVADAWQTNIDDITKDYSEITIPSAIQELIQRRINKLNPETQRVLQVASVINQDFSPELISQISGLSEWTVIDSFEQAQTTAIIFESSFQHDLLRQSIYKLITASRKSLIHLKTAQALENIASAGIVAEHYFAANDIANAIKLWLKLATELEDSGFVSNAINILNQTLKLDCSNDVQLVIKEKLAANYKSLAKHDVSEELVCEILSQNPNKTIKVKSLLIRAGNLVQFGQITEAQKTIKKAQRLAKKLNDEDIRLLLNSSAAMVEDQLGNYSKALEYLEIYLPAINNEEIAANMFFVVTSLAALYSSVDRLEDAEIMHQKALALAKKLNSKYYQVEAVLNMLFGPSEIVQARGVFELAEEVLEFGRYEGSDTLRANLATAYFDLKDFKKSEKHYKYLTTESNKPNLLLVSWAKLAEIYSINNTDKPLVSQALNKALGYAQETEFYIVHAILINSILKFGTSKQRKQIKPYLENLAIEKLPDYLQDRLEQSLEQFPI